VWVFGQNSKNDTSTRNCVLKYDLKFHDSENNKVKVESFTSLRISKIFFKNQHVVGDYDPLSISANKRLLQQKFMTAMKHVNNKGGWTIVGWYIRGELEDETKDENDTNKLSEKLKPNISYLYPTTFDPKNFPDDCLFSSGDLKIRTNVPASQANSAHGLVSDNL
jgi:hypothetical protein